MTQSTDTQLKSVLLDAIVAFRADGWEIAIAEDFPPPTILPPNPNVPNQPIGRIGFCVRKDGETYKAVMDINQEDIDGDEFDSAISRLLNSVNSLHKKRHTQPETSQ